MRKLRLVAIFMILNSISAIFISYINFHGPLGEPYSLLNHFVSELGDLRYSTTAWIFNLSLITLTILISLWFYEIQRALKLANEKLIVIIFIITMISVASVGVFNRNIQPWHKIATTLTFTSDGLLMLTLTNALQQANVYISKFYKYLTTTLVFLYFGLFGLGAFFFDIVYMSNVTDGITARPQIWPIAMIEWGIFTSMLVWVISIAFGINPYLKKEQD